ncbi:heme biosynthesis HemY N-terminal domain-containing protein [Pseudoalteromonas umbrosa]|uniref:heme biosynthesis HemY N-terminal domain-containing protein n=1 Tax=Pseudoalteromonas umbrosa TaxID=3048489 RepID=UPI0024C372FE|nr:heme biosynthesis HemY N-terminal domain-containing protein [Pseudoalteromonas sp. B95]MDK1290406.1 heme biosynthesis HemY N-terminal domain-containing protein [Pseudoalteromonas sp. B95]
MIRWLFVVILFFVVMAGAHILIDEKGYVLVSAGVYTIESTLVSLVFMLCLALAIGAILLKIGKAIWRVIAGVSKRRSKKRIARQEAAFEQSVWALINGQDESLSYALQKAEFPEKWRDQQCAIQAKAALHAGQKVVAREYLQQLSEPAQSKVSQLWLAAEQEDQALETLAPQAQMKKASPTQLHAYISALLQARDWDTLQSTIMQRHKQLHWSESQWDSFFHDYFSAIAQHTDKDLQALQSALPRGLRALSHAAFVTVCVRTGQLAPVRKELIKLLKKDQVSELAEILQHLDGADIELRKLVQSKLKKQPEQSDLLFCLACLANGEGDHSLAAKIFDMLSNEPWQALWQHQAQRAFAKTGQYEKAYLLLSDQHH